MREPTGFSIAAGSLLALATSACSSSSSAPPPTSDAGGADAAADAAPAGLDPSGNPPACVGGGTSGGSPPPRGDSAGALDATGTRLVVFGGDTAVPTCPISAAHQHVNDTWIFDPGCGTWAQVGGDAPPARARHAMALDPADNRALVFGGRARAGSSGAYTLFDDVWAFDFAAQSWSKIAATSPPPARANTAIAVDSVGKQLVVFGGNTDSTGMSYTPLDDTWVMDLSTGAWRALTPPTKPPARLFHAAAIDASSRTLYVFGGAGADALTASTFMSDVWALDLAHEAWTRLNPGGDPPNGRINHVMTFDATSRRLVVFGGHDDGVVGNQNDLYTLDLTAPTPKWTHLPGGDTANKPSTGQCSFPPDFTVIDKAAPERRSAMVFGPRVDGRAFVLYAGKSDCGLLGDAWWWAGGAERWSVANASSVGVSCLRTKDACTGLCQ